MAVHWQWDQGRGEYWRFDNIRKLAIELVKLDGAPTSGTADVEDDPLRALDNSTPLPFARNRSTHRLWRQYGRVIETLLLATEVNNLLAVTDVCRRLAGIGGPNFTVDEYLSYIVRRTYFPAPVWEHAYDETSSVVFPFALIIRHLVALHLAGREAYISVDEIIRRLASSDLTGAESLEELADLPEREPPTEIVARQVKESMRLIGQATFLFWGNGRLHLAYDGRDSRDLRHLADAMMPDLDTHDRRTLGLEVMRQGTVSISALQLPPSAELDLSEFREGSRVQVSHFRIERNTALRTAFFNKLSRSNAHLLCDVCAMNSRLRYPWTSTILEMHHLLPLQSAVRVEARGTMFDDLRGICPNCHRAVHQYYGRWLRDKRRPDFASQEEARAVYDRAKDAYSRAQGG